MTSSRACKAVNQDGSPCKMYPLKDSDYCFNHDPNLELERTQARVLGGSHTKFVGGLPVIIQTSEDVMAIISQVVGNLLAMDCTVAQSKALLLAAQTALSCLQIRQFEDRLAKIENLLEDKNAENIITSIG